jgi:hypothetical protein
MEYIKIICLILIIKLCNSNNNNDDIYEISEIKKLENKLICLENEQLYKYQMQLIKNALNQIYVNIDAPNEYCLKIPVTLKGYLNSNEILANANISNNLVQFYDFKNKTFVFAKDKDLFYLNETEHSSFSSTNDLLLNVSNKLYGSDGVRIELGGHWKPNECKSNFKIAIIIPYRDRLIQLKVLIHYLHLILQRQQLDYRIFVVEPTTPSNVRFNKGRVMNAAFIEALKIDSSIECFIFHDVDLIPEDDRIMYTCPPRPRHLSVAIDRFNYILPYSYLVGGVFVISTQIYKKINGYSNMYWGWGGEDDDMHGRLKEHKFDVIRPPINLNRYKMMRHKAQKLNPNVLNILKNKTDFKSQNDGLNTVNYTVIKKTFYTGFTHYLIDIGTMEDS